MPLTHGDHIMHIELLLNAFFFLTQCSVFSIYFANSVVAVLFLLYAFWSGNHMSSTLQVLLPLTYIINAAENIGDTPSGV